MAMTTASAAPRQLHCNQRRLRGFTGLTLRGRGGRWRHPCSGPAQAPLRGAQPALSLAAAAHVPPRPAPAGVATSGGRGMDPGPGHTRAMGRGVAQVGAAGLGLALASALLPATGAGGAPAPPIRVSVVLPVHHVVAGRLLKATVVLKNTTTKPIIVQQCAIDGWLAVGLTGKVDSYPFGHEAVGCEATVKIKPGANRFPIHITTSYAACTGASPAGNRPDAISPNCVLEAGRQSPPPLPAGSYTTKVDIVGLDGLTGPAPPVRVRITAPASAPTAALRRHADVGPGSRDGAERRGAWRVPRDGCIREHLPADGLRRSRRQNGGLAVACSRVEGGRVLHRRGDDEVAARTSSGAEVLRGSTCCTRRHIAACSSAERLASRTFQATARRSAPAAASRSTTLRKPDNNEERRRVASLPTSRLVSTWRQPPRWPSSVPRLRQDRLDARWSNR